MADTGLPNKEDSRFPSVPPRPCLFHQLALSKDRKKRSKLHVSLLIFPQASDSLCHPFFFSSFFLSVLPCTSVLPSHLWPSLLYHHLTIRTTIPKTPPRPTSTPPSRRPPQLSLSPKLQHPTVVIPPRPPPLVPRRTNTEIPSTSNGRRSLPPGGEAAGAYLFSQRVARLYVLILFFVPHQDLPSQTKSTSSVSASLRPSTWSMLTHRPAFPASRTLPLPLTRNATNSVKKVTLVAPAVVCNSNA